MKTNIAITCAALAVLLGPVAAIAGEDADADRSHAKAYVKNSAITIKIKARLAKESLTSVGHIHVDTDRNGAVWLSGTARSQEGIDRAVAIAKGTERVKSVHSTLTIKKDD